MKQIATFEKVSLEEYLRSKLKFVMKELIGDEKYQELVDKYTAQWNQIRLPCRATAGSAGYDFYLPDGCHVYAGDSGYRRYNEPISTGIRCRIAPGYVLLLVPRSGLGFKSGLRLVNTVGVIDSDYYNADNEGHIMAKLGADEDIDLKAGDRFMQGFFVPFGITTDDAADASRSGGFGSTGK